MKSKWTLFAGIILLTAGIIIRKTTDLTFEAITLIVIGVILKVYYIIEKTRSGEYRPGFELVLLLVGLIMFLSGLYLRNHEPPLNPLWLIIPGISLKIIFIILFIRKTRQSRRTFLG